jgi:hypothetical protein
MNDVFERKAIAYIEGLKDERRRLYAKAYLNHIKTKMLGHDPDLPLGMPPRHAMQTRLVLTKLFQKHSHHQAISSTSDILFANSLRKALAFQHNSDSGDPQSLEVIQDMKGHKLLEKLYRDHIHDEDVTYFPQFVLDVDSLLKDAGGQPYVESEDEEGNEDEDQGSKEVKGSEGGGEGQRQAAQAVQEGGGQDLNQPSQDKVQEVAAKEQEGAKQDAPPPVSPNMPQAVAAGVLSVPLTHVYMPQFLVPTVVTSPMPIDPKSSHFSIGQQFFPICVSPTLGKKDA